jgi:hypothetical protein
MNRRQFFGLSAVAIPATTIGQVEFYGAGTPQCAKCLHVMPVTYSPAGEHSMECPNSKCPEYGRKMLVPTTKTERVESGPNP